MKTTIAGVGAILLLGACSNGEASGDGLNFMNVDETLTTENVVANDVSAEDSTVPVLQPVSHNYDFHEDDLYGYIGAVSEEDQKRGKAAGEVLMFRYKGFWDSNDHLEQVDANGRTVSYDECARPCVAIKSRYYGRVERIAFNPSSIIGAAFQDAINGTLEAPIPPSAAKTADSSVAPGEAQSGADAVPKIDNSDGDTPTE